MRFQYDGRTYAIEFQRAKRKVAPVALLNSPEPTVPSTKPYTTVRIVELDSDGQQVSVFRQATVGCFAKDQFSKEGGRIAALRALTPVLPEPMRPVVWDAYTDRPMHRHLYRKVWKTDGDSQSSN